MMRFAPILLIRQIIAVVRLPLSFIDIPGDWQPYFVTSITVDGQDLYAQIDTGSAYLFYIWKKWYNKDDPKACDTLPFKCYTCKPTECSEGPTTKLSFADKSAATVFQHTGDFNFVPQAASGISFGLIVDYKYAEHELSPLSIIGLGLGTAPDPYISLMEQLIRKPAPERLIGAKIFSMYLKPGKMPTGELILGEDDPKLHYGLRYVRNAGVDFWGVEVEGLKVGTHEHNFPRGTTVDIDTGASGIFLSDSTRDEIIEFLKIEAPNVELILEDEGYVVKCKDRHYLPPITVVIVADDEPILFEIPQENYVGVISEPKQKCKLLLYVDDIGFAALGVNILPGNFILFDQEQLRIGFGELIDSQP